MADPLDLDQIKGILAAELASADEFSDSDLQQQRADAMDYYLGDMSKDLPAPEGRSGAVSTDVADVVEDLVPQVMEVFAAGDSVIEFEPVGPEDEEAARQETDYVNHVFWHENPGFNVLYDFCKDALLQKNGVVKVWWEETTEAERETYRGLDDDTFALLVADPDIELAQHTATAQMVADPLTMGEPITMVAHDVVVQRQKVVGKCRVQAVPPDEFGIARRARSIDEAPYVYHKVRRTPTDLLQQGYDPDCVEKLPNYTGQDSEEEYARRTLENWDTEDTVARNKAMRLVEVVEHYTYLDIEGDGIAQLYRITTGAKATDVLTKGGVPDIEQIDVIPFAAMTPVPQSHAFWGRSVADLVMDIQRIKTALLRAGLDNVYFLNNQRFEVAESHIIPDVTLDDLLTNRPGGLVRVRQPGGVTPIQNQPIIQHLSPIIEYMDQTRDQRTGAARNGGAIDPNVLKNVTLGASNELMSLQKARVRLICRIFAETGIKRMFMLMHHFILKHDRKERVVRMRGKWIPIDPRQWRTRTDMTVSVGLGTGTKDQQLIALREILQVQTQALTMQGNPNGPMVTLPNIYNTLRRMVEFAGLRSPDLYFTEPTPEAVAALEQNKQPDPKMVEAQQKMQLEQVKASSDFQLEQAKMRADFDLRRMQMEAEIQLSREKMLAEIELKREQMAIQSQQSAMQAAMSPVRMGGEVG